MIVIKEDQPTDHSKNLYFAIEPRKTESLTPDDVKYWREVAGERGKPKEIIIATGSSRKAEIWTMLQMGFFPPSIHDENHFKKTDEELKLNRHPAQDHFIDPREFYYLFSKYLSNGDGSFTGKRLLSYWHGVPVYAEYEEGESPENNPENEAKNKIMALAKKHRGEDVIILATDAVDGPVTPHLDSEDSKNHPNYPQDGSDAVKSMFELVYGDLYQVSRQPNRRPSGAISFGKPGKLPGYLDLSNNYQSDELKQKQTDYLRTYSLIIFLDGVKYMHSNGVASIRIGSLQEDQVLEEAIKVSVTDLSAIARPTGDEVAVEDVGGGGHIQNTIDWSILNSILLTMDDSAIVNLYEKLELQIYENKSLTPDAKGLSLHQAVAINVLSQILGMPFWALISHIEELDLESGANKIE